MFERLLDVTVRYLRVTPVRYPVLPLDHLSNATHELHVGDQEAVYMMFAERVTPLIGGIVPLEDFFSLRSKAPPSAGGERNSQNAQHHWLLPTEISG